MSLHISDGIHSHSLLLDFMAIYYHSVSPINWTFMYVYLMRKILNSVVSLLTLTAHKLGASGGGFLASARKSIRSSLKGALTAASSRRRADVSAVRLPPAIDSLDSLRDAPPPLRILPARFYVREAMFRRFSIKVFKIHSESRCKPGFVYVFTS